MREDAVVRDRSELLATMTDALAKVTGNIPSALSESTRLRDDLGLDSFAGLELVFEIEDRTQIRIPQEAASQFRTVGDVVTFIEEALATSGQVGASEGSR